MNYLIISNKNKLKIKFYQECNDNIKEMIVDINSIYELCDFLNKNPKIIKSYFIKGSNLTFFIDDLCVTLKDYKCFKQNKHFSFIFNKIKNKKIKLHVLNIIKRKFIPLSLATFILIGYAKIDKIYKKNIIINDDTKELSNDYSDYYLDNYNKVSDKEILYETNVVKDESTTFEILDENLEKLSKTKNLYFEIINKYSNMYNLDPNIILAIATQERGVHSDKIDSGGAIGLMQIEVSVWNNKDITTFNYEINKNETEHITIEKLKDEDYNIKVGCMIFSTYLKQMNGNIPAAIQSYNMGPSSVNKILDTYCSCCGKTKDEVLKQNDLGWLLYRNSSYSGDPFYFEHVSRYVNLDNCKIR